ncbi:hypothetical protein [Methylibium sp.]|uniref:hypothetical protein n=1 Tax=Methylibium sp. TaxID=2067992 RepID=UPI00184446A1|nr:hypothetical protein [Methylibium sp.]MBA3588511.1 hypothetical protein [Methylibium sp.]
MRFFILALVVGSLSAAQETFTLDDGRTITGEYDDADQRLYTTIAGKTQSLLIANDQIVERVPVGTKKPLAPLPANGAAVAPPVIGAAPVAEAPKPMTPEEKKAADAAYSLALLDRASDKLIAESEKATRDAASARKDSAHQIATARNHWRAFCKRAALEGVPCDPNVPSRELIILPRTSGNNRATVESLLLADQRMAKAGELDALAARKRVEAAAVARGR